MGTARVRHAHCAMQTLTPPLHTCLLQRCLRLLCRVAHALQSSHGLTNKPLDAGMLTGIAVPKPEVNLQGFTSGCVPLTLPYKSPSLPLPLVPPVCQKSLYSSWYLGMRSGGKGQVTMSLPCMAPRYTTCTPPPKDDVPLVNDQAANNQAGFYF